MDGGDSDEDTLELNVYCDSDQSQEDPEPELAVTGDDAVADEGLVVYDCSYCGINLCSEKLKVKHEVRCKVRVQRKELESQVTKLYHCSYCKCPFLNKEYKERHQQKYCKKRSVTNRRKPIESDFECDQCEYVTKRKLNLKRHILNHIKSNTKWLTCTQCSYKTVHKHDLTRHSKIHSNPFSYSPCCPICGKSFTTKQSLDKHLVQMHSNDWDEVSKVITTKIYTCNTCNQYKTISKADLKLHDTLIHQKSVGCQKYQCPRCPYSTFHKNYLKVHSKTHTVKKDFQCAVCKRQVTLKAALDGHILTYHADNVDLVKTITSTVHHCKLCSFKTVETRKLKKHVESNHS